MSLQTLPNDILLGILQHVSSWEYYNAYHLKNRLYLLGISQQLRAIALPKIYSTVYITSSANESYKFQNYTNKYIKKLDKYTDTNADIIALANCTHMVKSAKMYVYSPNTTFAELHNYADTFQSCANVWPKITKLEISIICNMSSNPSKTHLIQLSQMSIEYSQILANIMPDVTELTLSNERRMSDVCEFYSQLAATYADQLVKLTNQYDVDHTGSHTFKVMQYLHIRMGINKRLPHINSHTLVDLHIDNIPGNVSWESFLDSKDDTVIEFSCLKRLYLEFSFKVTKVTIINIPELLLNFPELCSLSIKCYTEVCPFFNMARFPDVMDYINIKAHPALLAQLRDVGMPIAKKMCMSS